MIKNSSNIKNCFLTTILIIKCLGAVVQFHNSLNGLRVGRGTGSATLEAKLLHKLTAIREEVLYEVFLDLTKAYGMLDQ